MVRDPRRAITLIEVLVVIFILGLLVALLLPVTRGAHESAYRNQCQGRIKQIGLALLNYENALGRFPLISSRHDPQLSAANTAKPASATPGPTEAGWSWIVRVLPYLEETNLYKTIQSESADFSVETGPFTPSIAAAGKAPPAHCSSVAIPALICPSWGGNPNTNGNSSIDVVGTTSGAPEYASIHGNVAPTNYKAIVGTHLVAGVPLENGSMLLTASAGSKIDSFTDGTSKTFLLAETKECGYASWYDGTLNWLVTNDPSAAITPGTGSGAAAKGPWTHAIGSINVGPTPANPTNYYLPKNLTSNAPLNSVNWGPSSDHSNGAVMHVFADDHVQAVTVLCDAETYLNLTTRAGGEKIDASKTQ
jgi:prepilin-type N-terminal cleavage/methylation domain-containing protein